MANGNNMHVVTPQSVENAFREIREQMKKAKDCKPNVYQIMGLSSQEENHSTFFGGLLNPNGAHALGTTVLKKFLAELWSYQTQTDKRTTQFATNETILKKEFGSKTDYDDFVSAITDATVRLEENTDINPTTNKKGRMDILIEIPNGKAVIVIENKTGSKSHDDQLVTYVRDVNAKYHGYRKIFVYLSPKGELPYNLGGDGLYNPQYCVFDYTEERGICKLIQEILQNKSNKKSLKITYFALEQYLDMCRKEILEGGIIVNYKQIYQEYKQQYEKLKEFEQSAQNEERVIPFCADYLQLHATNSGHWFHTQQMKDVFFRIDGQIDQTVCRVVIQIDGEKLVGYINLARDNIKTSWTDAQDKILTQIQASKRGKDVRYQPIDSATGKRGSGSFTLLTEEEQNNSFEAIETLLETRLDAFKKSHLDTFADVLNKI